LEFTTAFIFLLICVLLLVNSTNVFTAVADISICWSLL